MSLGKEQNKTVQKLHHIIVPKLYRFAFYLLGDTALAEELTAQAWLKIMTDPAAPCMQEELLLSALAALYPSCKQRKGNVNCRWETTSGEQTPLLKRLSTLSFTERVPLVFAAAFDCDVQKIAQITGCPVWLIQRRLTRSLEKIAEETKQLTVDCGRLL